MFFHKNIEVSIISVTVSINIYIVQLYITLFSLKQQTDNQRSILFIGPHDHLHVLKVNFDFDITLQT